MAITIISDPNIIQTAYNPLYYVVSSNNTAQPNFQYVFNLYSGLTATGTPLSTVNLLPRPDGTCIYNPARTIESYVGTDKDMQKIVAVTPSKYNFISFTVDMGEFYTGTTHTGLQTITNGAFNGVLQYKEIPTWSYTSYLVNNTVTSTTVNFLTNQPRDGVSVNVYGNPSGAFHLDAGSVSYLTLANFQPTTARYTVYYQGLSFSSATYDLAISSSTAGFIYHIPAGPANINSAIGGPVIQLNATSYTIQLLNGANHSLSEALLYIVDPNCSKYTPVRLQFLNRLGGWDYANFNLVSRKTINATKRDMYKKNLPYNYVVGDRETTMINFDGNYTYTLNTDYLTQGQSNWMEELFTSQNINIVSEDGLTVHPVNLTDGTVEIKKSINDKLLQYTFSLDSAFIINTQRG